MKLSRNFCRARAFQRASKFGFAAREYRLILRCIDLSPLQKAEAHLGAGDALRLQGDFKTSLTHYRQARRGFDGVGSPRAVDAVAGLALAARASGDPATSVRLLKKVLAFYRADGDSEGEAFALWALGGAERIAGDLKNGWEHLLEALRLYKRQGDKEGEAYTRCALGGLARMRGLWKKSALHYAIANRLHRARKDVFGTAYSYCGRGNVHRMAGRWDEALKFFRRAERLYKRIGDRVSYAYTLWSIGTAFKMKGDTQAARWNFASADRLFRRTGDDRGRAYVFLGLAELEWLEGKNGEMDLRKAIGFARKGHYAWENIHARMMKGGRIAGSARRVYARAGSKFCPKGFPINWP